MLKKCLTNRWLKQCVQLSIFNYNTDDKITSHVTDGSLVRFSFVFIQSNLVNFSLILFKFKTLDPAFAESLQFTDFRNVPSGN
jgi:hypothetical protein